METMRKLETYSERYCLEYYDEVLSRETDFEVWKHLSILRTGLLAWYPFRENSYALEISAGYGALTGILCDRCAEVTATEAQEMQCTYIKKRWGKKQNLHVVCQDAEAFHGQHYYDYIVLTEIFENIGKAKNNYAAYSGFLQELSNQLTENGKILLAVNNRFGLRYLCGAIDEHTGEAFGGVCGYSNEERGRSFSRVELKRIAEASGASDVIFYYPLPDYRFPQLIYTDDYLPRENLRERLRPYYPRNDTLVANELSLYDDVVKNHAFPFVANSFLLELSYASKNKSAPQVVYSALTTDRKRDRAYATVIYKDGRVQKRPLYRDTTEGNGRLIDNFRELRERHIPVLELKEDNQGVICERYVDLPTLSEYLKTVIHTNADIAYKVFDRLREFVMMSSEQAPEEDNALLSQYDCAGVDFGPILKRAYLELIPMNCFFDSETGEYLFFDQEFVKRNYPASYILYRSIRYFYEHNAGIEKIYPKEEMMRRYHLQEVWGIYDREEEKLQQDNCQWERYRSFYESFSADEKRMRENHRNLESELMWARREDETEIRKRIKRVMLDLLDEFDRVCKKYGLTYFLFYGTLLGAVRHHGFIPWDEDIDVVMYRDAYDRFRQIAKKELRYPYTLTTMADNPYGNPAPLMHLVNENTTHIEPVDMGKDGIHGIHIDIQPLDVYPADESDRRRLQKRMDLLSSRLGYYIYGKDITPHDGTAYLRTLWNRVYVSAMGYKNMCAQLERAMQMFADSDSPYVGCWLDWTRKMRRHEKKDFAQTVTLEFEGKEYPAPAGYANVLFQLYGADYMQPPPENDRAPHRHGIRNPDVPYRYYHKLLNGLFDGVKGKKVIVFGAGLMLEDYMEKYGARYRPSFIVDNDSGKWEHEVFGIDIKPPAAILTVPPQKRHVIICSYYYREIMKQLDEMGVEGYKVYVQNPEWIETVERKELER